MLKSIFNSESITLDLDKLLCMVSAIILGIVIALVHKKTTNTSKKFYRDNSNFTNINSCSNNDGKW